MQTCNWLNHSIILRSSIPFNLLHSNTFVQPEMINKVVERKELSIIETHDHTVRKKINYEPNILTQHKTVHGISYWIVVYCWNLTLNMSSNPNVCVKLLIHYIIIQYIPWLQHYCYLLSCTGFQLKVDRLHLRNKTTKNSQLTIKELHQWPQKLQLRNVKNVFVYINGFRYRKTTTSVVHKW